VEMMSSNGYVSARDVCFLELLMRALGRSIGGV